MNLPLKRTVSGSSGNAGAVGIGVPGAAPAQTFTVGNVQFSNAQLPADVADEVMEQMADSIVELTHQLEEANARIALLEEEQKILAERFDARLHGAGKTAEVKAAVTEGGTGYSGVERPEPPPHYFERRFREVHKANARIAGELRKAREAIRAVLAEKWLFDPQCAEDQALVDRLKEEALK